MGQHQGSSPTPPLRHRPRAARHAAALAAAMGLAGLLAGGPARAQLTLASGEPQTLFQASNFLANISKVSDLAVLPDGRVVVVARTGEVVVRTPDGTLVRPTRVAAKPVNNENEQGLLGVVAHPDFAQNRTLFFYGSVGNSIPDKNQIVRATLTDDNTLTVDYAKPVLSFEGPHKHNGSMMIIHDNQLYLAVGDSGAQNPVPQNKYSSCLNKANGSILRVNFDGSIPDDNPLVGLEAVTGCTTNNRLEGPFSMQPPEKRIYAWGLRNPYRFWVDPKTGLLWIGDVGEKRKEEISIGGLGSHFGYPFEEGTYKWTQADEPWNTFGGCQGMTPSRPCTPPVFEYNNPVGNPTGDNCIIGGLIPEGCGWKEPYTSRYIFGDHGSGKIWTLDVTPDRKGVVADSRRAFGTMRGLTGFRMGPDGTLYAISNDANAVARLWPKERPANCVAAAPADAGAGMDPTDAAVDPSNGSPDAGAGGSGGESGASGGAAGAGGASGGAFGGSPGTGGSGGGAGQGTGRAGSGGGSSAAGGSAAGSGGPIVDETSSPSGGCQMGGGSPGLPSALLVLAIGWAWRRRRDHLCLGRARSTAWR